MPRHPNEQLVREYFLRPRADFYTEDAELHDMSQPSALRGREAVRDFLRAYLEAFPGGQYELRHVVANDGGAAVEWTFRGTNSGPLMGTPPTGRAVEFSGVSVYEITDDRFSRARIYYDTGSLADQLGLVGERLPAAERARWAEWWEQRQG